MTETAGKEPARAARVMLIAAMLGNCYLSFFRYKTGGFDDPQALDARLLGRSPAPEQYRIGVYAVAHWMTVHLHMAPTMALALLDGVASLIAVLLLFGVLARSAVFASASRTLRWFGAAAFVLLVLWFMVWLPWLQKPETLPAAAFVAMMLWLWEPKESSPPTSQRARALAGDPGVPPQRAGALAGDPGVPPQRAGALAGDPGVPPQRAGALAGDPGVRHPALYLLWSAKAVGLVALSVGLATFRADVACLLNAGVFLFLALRKEQLSLPRPAAMLTAGLGALSAGGMQFWLMRVVYPAASYGRVKMWQLWPNLKHGSRWPPFVFFMLPLAWMAVQGMRRALPKDTAGRALLLAAALYAALWIAIGKIDEVRIFVPFALALTPLIVQVAMRRVEHES